MKVSRFASLAVALGLGAAAQAADFGTAAEARAMLEKTLAAMKADPAGTIAKINQGAAGGFLDRDLYPFCGDKAGMFVAHAANQKLVGVSMRDLKDKEGKAIGEAFYAAAGGGEVDYKWPRPGADTTPVGKVAFVGSAGDYVCAVGYYQ